MIPVVDACAADDSSFDVSLESDTSPEQMERAEAWLERFKLMMQVADAYYGVIGMGSRDREQRRVLEDMLTQAQERAIYQVGCCGLLEGLEVRDECGEFRKVIAGLDIKSDWGSAMLVYRDDGADYLSDLGIGGAGFYLALPGTKKLYDDATLEALEARLKARAAS